jgi:Mrp family chromosome partitioning ATPase
MSLMRGRAPFNTPLPAGVVAQLAGVAAALAAHPTRPRTIALISAQPGEGTSTCVVSLGRYLSTFRHSRVLLVDGNPHHPALHAMLGVEPANGLAELLSGRIDFTAAAKPTSVDKLTVLTSGSREAFSVNGFLSPGALREQVLERAGAFEFVLVDCPAVNVNEDAAATAAACDGIILVVERRTPRQSAQTAKSLLARAEGNVLGILMNKRRFYIPQFLYERL